MNRLPDVVLASALLLVALPLGAEPPGPVDANLIEHVDVSVVNVDVVVVNKKGVPIEDLTADDFLVYENGQPVAITNFYAASRETGAESLSTVPVPEVPGDPTPTPASVGASASSDAPALFVVYVDNLRLMPHRRDTFLKQVREVLTTSLRPHDRVMVVTHRDGLRVSETFTSDLEAVGQALERIRGTMGDGIRERNDRQRVIDQFRDAIELAIATNNDPCSTFFELMAGAARSYADAARGRAGRSLQGLNSLTSALAGAPGRKIVLYLSDGIGVFPGLEMFHMLSEICPEDATDALSQGQQVNLVSQFQRLASHANANRITFYAIDATGLEGASTADARYEGPLVAGDRTFDVRPSAVNDTVRRTNRQNTLFTLANETGGRLIANGNDVRTDLQAMTRDAQTYYALGFQPARPHDDRVHRIRVKLAKERKGVELRYRRTYLAKTTDVRIAERTLAAMRFGFEDNPLDIVVASGAATVDDDGATTIPLRIELALGSLVTVPREGFHEGRVHVVISAQDERDRPVEMRQQFIPIRIAEDLADEARDARHTFEVSVPVETGETVLAVAVRDTLATTTSYVQHRIHTDPALGTR